MKTLTIDDLYAALKVARKAGKGGKKLLLSDDDEGNGYHELYFGLTDVTEDIERGLPFGLDIGEALADYMILG